MAPDLPRICYAAAYRVLPKLVFSGGEKILETWDADPVGACAAIYSLACKARREPSNAIEAMMIRMHIGQLDDSRRYYIIEYPFPRPLDRTKFDPWRLPFSKCAVLAPYFSAVIRNSTTGEIYYLVLGQSPSGGTTLRVIEADGANYNCGPGPDPKLESWIQFLKG